ncbi:MAG: UDP-N-acetylglucosamine 2-epimerase (non-hydrolyzing) [Sphingobacteriales bacterium]|nr:MAG: UDP-N-acetylglucosamine 2-epimerase (non-hydrolyzing) [Sphingobacteriales bacterium]
MFIDIVAGARPNFVKIASIISAISAAQQNGSNIRYRLVHTGQHYGPEMSDNFFRDLQIPWPHVDLGVGSASPATQAGLIMMGYEKLLLTEKPDLTLVVGDVTSTMACAVVAKKMGVKLAHLEAGLRSFDMKMPEEVNRMVTDAISEYFFTTSATACDNLLNTGISEDRIFFVGNTMIDTLLKFEGQFRKPKLCDELNLTQKKYIVLTLHRPGNVDDIQQLKTLIEYIDANVRNTPVVFPLHPRTALVLQQAGLATKHLHIVGPLGYLEFNHLVKNAMAVITDSGGVSEETTVLNVPCLTVRSNTERPETVELGTNMLVGECLEDMGTALDTLFKGEWKTGNIPELWDGKAGERAVAILGRLLQHHKNKHETLVS